MQRRGKHTSKTIDTVLCWGRPEAQAAEIELSLFEIAVENDWEEIARVELGCAKKTSCML
jgi:hypothetical protein